MAKFMKQFLTYFQASSSSGQQKIVFEKCRKDEARGEFSLFYPQSTEDAISLVDMVRSFESEHPSYRDTLQTEISNGRVYLSFNRPFLFRTGLLEIVDPNSLADDLFVGKKFRLTMESSAGVESLTRHRCDLVAETLTNILVASGAEETTEDGISADFHFVVNNKSNRRVPNGICVFVGPVICHKSADADDAKFSIDECKSALAEEIALMSEHRLGDNQDLSISEKDILVNASLKMALLSVNIKNSVTLKLGANVTTHCKRGIFIMYNYCRMGHIVHKYRKQVDDGYYPKLPDLESVNFALLTRPDEWDLLFNHIIQWPDVFKTVTSNLESGTFKIPLIIKFLNSLSTTFSVYYRCTRVLTEPRPNLMPVMEARIHLILGLMEVFKMALQSLGLQPLATL